MSRTTMSEAFWWELNKPGQDLSLTSGLKDILTESLGRQHGTGNALEPPNACLSGEGAMVAGSSLGLKIIQHVNYLTNNRPRPRSDSTVSSVCFVEVESRSDASFLSL